MQKLIEDMIAAGLGKIEEGMNRIDSNRPSLGGKVRPVKESCQLLSDPDDLQWLRDTVLKGVELPEFASFVIEGNEDWPTRVSLYTATEPNVDDQAVRVFDKAEIDALLGGKASERRVVVTDTAENRMHNPTLVGRVYEAGEAPAGVETAPVCPVCSATEGECHCDDDDKTAIHRRTWGKAQSAAAQRDRDKVAQESAVCEKTNDDVIGMFLGNSFPKDKKPSGTKHLYITRMSHGWAMVNYQTPILYRADGETDVYFNTQKYSTTTSKIQTLIRRTVDAMTGGRIVEVDEAGIQQAIERSPATESAHIQKHVTHAMGMDTGEVLAEEPEAPTGKKFTGEYGAQTSENRPPLTTK